MEELRFIERAIELLKSGATKRMDSPNGKIKAYIVPKAQTNEKLIRIDMEV